MIISTPVIRFSVMGALLLFSACTREAEEPVRTVSYYREHAEERKATLDRCADDPGRLGKTANCTNATKAGAIEGIGSFRDLPPMNLGGKKESGGSTKPEASPDPSGSR